MIRILAVDDEPLALERMVTLLNRLPDVEVAGTAGSGEAAIETAERLQPDAILLDVEMPDLDGLDVAEQLARGGMVPLIVFVTSFPRFAPSAFDIGATDFITKPVRLGRLEVAIGRIREVLEHRAAYQRLSDRRDHLAALGRPTPPDGDGHDLWVQHRGDVVRVDLRALELVAAEREYVRLYVGPHEYLHRGSVKAIQARLDPDRFVRIHRSYIIDWARVVAVQRGAVGSLRIVSDRDRTLPVGRSYQSAVRALVARGRWGREDIPAARA